MNANARKVHRTVVGFGLAFFIEYLDTNEENDR